MNVLMQILFATLLSKQKALQAPPDLINAHEWRCMCCLFKEASDDLCHALALLARHMCTQYIHPEILAPLLACRLVTLDKNPGVCEVARRIIS